MWLGHVSEQGPGEDPMRSEHPIKEVLLLNQFLYRIISRLFAFALNDLSIYPARVSRSPVTAITLTAMKGA